MIDELLSDVIVKVLVLFLSRSLWNRLGLRTLLYSELFLLWTILNSETRLVCRLNLLERQL